MEANLNPHYKALDAEVLNVEKEKGIVETYINTFNVVDTWNEVSLPGSFKKTFKENFKNIYWLKNHDWDLMPGITLKLYEDAKGAIAVGQINMKKQLGVDLWNDYLLYAENGRSLEHSVRIQPVKYIIENDVMYISEQKMMEWSSLTRPGSNPKTEVITLKNEKELMEAALKLNYSDEKLKAIETKIAELETLIKKAAESTLKNEPKPDFKKTIDFINNLTF